MVSQKNLIVYYSIIHELFIRVMRESLHSSEWNFNQVSIDRWLKVDTCLLSNGFSGLPESTENNLLQMSLKVSPGTTDEVLVRSKTLVVFRLTGIYTLLS